MCCKAKTPTEAEQTLQGGEQLLQALHVQVNRITAISQSHGLQSSMHMQYTANVHGTTCSGWPRLPAHLNTDT